MTFAPDYIDMHIIIMESLNPKRTYVHNEIPYPYGVRVALILRMEMLRWLSYLVVAVIWILPCGLVVILFALRQGYFFYTFPTTFFLRFFVFYFKYFYIFLAIYRDSMPVLKPQLRWDPLESPFDPLVFVLDLYLPSSPLFSWATASFIHGL